MTLIIDPNRFGLASLGAWYAACVSNTRRAQKFIRHLSNARTRGFSRGTRVATQSLKPPKEAPQLLRMDRTVSEQSRENTDTCATAGGATGWIGKDHQWRLAAPGKSCSRFWAHVRLSAGFYPGRTSH